MKQTYRQLYLPDTPIFLKPFYLDAVAKDNWDVSLVLVNGKLVASMPYMIQKTKGYCNLVQPPFTQFGGPWFSKEYLLKNRIGKEKQLLDSLFGQLPPHSSYYQNWSHELTNWLPLYWKGYSQTTRYTYLIPDTSNLGTLWTNLDPDVKRQVKNGESTLSIDSSEDFDLFYNTLEISFKRRKKNGLPNKLLFTSLNDACATNNCRRMLLAKDSNGLTKGAAYIVWDENSVYYLAGGVSTEGKNEGIMQLLLWEAIKFSSSMNLAFDFEGSMIESIERFFRSFGPQQKPYFAISKVNSKKITIIESLKSIKKVLSSDKISPNRSENDA